MLVEECCNRQSGKMLWLSRDDETRRTYPLDLEECHTALYKRYGDPTADLIITTLKVMLQAPSSDPELHKNAIKDIFSELNCDY